MTLDAFTSGEFPAARVRHTNYAYSATMTWGPDERATARTSSDLARTVRENVVEAAWAARVNLARRYDHGPDFTSREDYREVVAHMGASEYVVTFIPAYLAGVNR